MLKHKAERMTWIEADAQPEHRAIGSGGGAAGASKGATPPLLSPDDDTGGGTVAHR